MSYGAPAAAWQHFVGQGLTADLLPILCNPNAQISANSKLSDLGKVPSVYNYDGHAVGLPKWSQIQADSTSIALWSAEPDYGIGIQTRDVRAIDVDIADPELAGRVREHILLMLGAVPLRGRADSSKFLAAFRLVGELPKRKITCAAGIIEFLGNGQQFVAAGTHPSGARYTWDYSPPRVFPRLEIEALEGVWESLKAKFGAPDAVDARTATIDRHQLSRGAVDADPLAAHLAAASLVLDTYPDRLNITCPFAAEHTTGAAGSSTTYFLPNFGGWKQGHFACLHAHCAHRTDREFMAAVGYRDPAAAPDFEDVSGEPQGLALINPPPKRRRSNVLHIEAVGARPGIKWLIRKLLPAEGLGAVYAAPGAGKSFVVLDLAAHIGLGAPDWNGLTVAKGRVLYIVAEGEGGFGQRAQALAMKYELPLRDFDVFVQCGALNLMDTATAQAFVDEVKELGPFALVVVDTLAQSMAGGNENSGEDMGRLIDNLKHIGASKALGGLVLVVHHVGKDETRGARGWSGLKGALDVEISLSRSAGQIGLMQVTKQKDGQDGQAWGYELSEVHVGVDDIGESVTSMTVKYCAAPSPQQRALGDIEKLVVAAVNDLAPMGTPVEWSAVVDAVAAGLDPPVDGTRDQRRTRVGKTRAALVRDEILALDGTKVWVPD